MRIIELIELAKTHNELLLQWIKGEIWFQNPNIPNEEKKKHEKRYIELIDKVEKSYNRLDEIGITFDYQEGISCIELPQELKRSKIEGWLEEYKRCHDEREQKEKEMLLINE